MTRKRTIGRVLELKEFAEEQLKAEVKRVNDKIDAEKAGLKLLEDTFENTAAAIYCRQNKEPLNINEVGLLYDYLSHLERQIEKKRNAVFVLAEELEMKKREMLEAYREKRTFEKLRDRILLDEKRNTIIMDQKEADYNFMSKKSRE